MSEPRRGLTSEEEGVFFASLMIDDIQTAVARRMDARTGGGGTREGGRGDRVRGRINHRRDVVAITSWHEAIYPGRAGAGEAPFSPSSKS